MSVVVLSPILLLAIVAAALFLAVVLVRTFSNPEARKIAKIFILLPFMVFGALLLAFVVLMAAYRFAAYRPAATATVVPDASEIIVLSNGTHVRISDGAVKLSTSDRPGASAPPATVRHRAAASADSNVARMFRAVKTAFLTTIQSALEKNLKNKSPSGVEGAKAVNGTEVAARPETPLKEALPAAAASAAANPASARPAPTASASSPPSAPVAATKRPDWVDNPPQPSAESYEVAVNSGPWKTRLECEQALNEEIGLAVDNYVAWQLGEEARSQVSLPDDAVRHQLLAEQWLEKVDTKFGEQMLNLHALLRFDSQIDSKLREAWNQLLVTGRIVGSGAILGGALLLLAVIYAYLRFSRGSPRPLRERGEG